MTTRSVRVTRRGVSLTSSIQPGAPSTTPTITVPPNMVYIVNVGYPSAPGARFDMKYYLSTHMPLVQKSWEKNGLQHWFITQYDGAESPYAVQAVLVFRDAAAFQKSSGEGDEVFGDIPNFTDLKPTIFHGERVGEMK